LFFLVYLIVGIMFVMLLISVITQIPQLNLAKLFSLERDAACDPERQLLAENVSNSTSYTRQVDEDEPTVVGGGGADANSDENIFGSKY
jgi:hypothetical protein